MIYSMTAYSHRQFNFEQGMLSIELRSVNHRFLEIALKLSEELRYHEAAFRTLLARLIRGKIECKINVASPVSLSQPFQYDTHQLQALCTTLRSIQMVCPESAWPTLDVLLQFPGVLKQSECIPAFESADQIQPVVQALETVLEEFEQRRSTEGERIKGLLLGRAKECQRIVTSLLKQRDQFSQEYKDFLTAKLSEVVLNVDQERLIQEVTLLALRGDVNEELERLSIHLETVETALMEGGSVGKRLDFLMQELNREANTLASKAADIRLTHPALQLKLLIEQMREQIQNLV